MSSKSSSSPLPEFLRVGRIAGHRGNRGEMTVRVAAGEAHVWDAMTRVRVEAPDGSAEFYEVETSRSYRDRWVLKLRGIDDGNRAAGLRGHVVQVSRGQLDRLPEGVHHVGRLVGLTVREADGSELGRVVDVVPTGGVDLLRVDRGESEDADDELLIPLADEFIVAILEQEGRIEVRLPPGLRDLNREVKDDRC